jgi:methylaspartate ammonia-lyase
MKIIDIVCSKSRTGFFFDDQRAIKSHAVKDGASYKGKPITEGFTFIRQPGEAISIMMLLEDGQIAMGDCAAVQYSGAGGRDPLFLADEYIEVINKHIKPILIGRELNSFRRLAKEIDELINPETGLKYHTAIRYGLSQAILDAVAKAKHTIMERIVEIEYQLEGEKKPVPIFMQTGDQRYSNADKMIIKGADVLPHGLINNVPDTLGYHGEKLKEYIIWLRERVMELRESKDYFPTLHLDVYGTIGIIFEGDIPKMVDYMEELAAAASPLLLRIEGPIDVENRQGQMEALRDITKLIDDRNIKVEIVADEWCNTLDDVKFFADNKAGHMVQVKTPDLGSIHNTIEAVIYCKKVGIEAYQGGTCNETDGSARACVHIAVATQPTQMLAKPGMGVDEGYMIVYNEMNRVIALKDLLCKQLADC